MGAAIAELLERFGAQVGAADALREGASLSLGWPELDDALPDHGLPRGVVELTAPRALGGSTSIALAAMRAAHARDARGWCAWIDPDASLYAPGIASAGVDLARLFVVRPPRAELARVTIKVAASRAFDVIAVDVDAVPGAGEGRDRARTGRGPRDEVLVRKLALLAEEGGAVILLLTDSSRPHPQPWPVALRLELARTERALVLRVGKDKQGRVGLAKTVPLRTKPGARKAG